MKSLILNIVIYAHMHIQHAYSFMPNSVTNDIHINQVIKYLSP